jgi:hypothetical protein
LQKLIEVDLPLNEMPCVLQTCRTRDHAFKAHGSTCKLHGLPPTLTLFVRNVSHFEKFLSTYRNNSEQGRWQYLNPRGHQIALWGLHTQAFGKKQIRTTGNDQAKGFNFAEPSGAEVFRLLDLKVFFAGYTR